MLVISEKQVQGLLDLDELIAALEQAHVQFSAGKVVMPVRLVVPLPEIPGPDHQHAGVHERGEGPGDQDHLVFPGQSETGPAADSGHHLDVQRRDRQARGADGRRLHYGHPHRVRVGHGYQGAGAAGNAGAGSPGRRHPRPGPTSGR